MFYHLFFYAFRGKFNENVPSLPMLCGSLSPRHGAPAACEWRKRPEDVEGNCVYIALELANNGQRVDLQFGNRTKG
jgi:hypothetical protein